MNDLSEGAEAALAPVREALFAAARSAAADMAEAAHERARQVLDEATADADRLRATAHVAGEAAGRSEAALRSARIRRQANESVLARQNDLRLALQRRVSEAATALRDAPRYPELMSRLAERGRAVLGNDATITESPVGGVIAERGSRRLDLSLPTLAAATLESISSRISTLWTPQ